MPRFDDRPYLPGRGGGPGERFTAALPLAGTPGQAYVERRGVPMVIAEAAGVRFDADFGGRPAVLTAVRDDQETLLAVHGRYLHTVRGQNKMLTLGTAGGVVSVLGGWRTEPLLIVEGVFDALALATCGWPCIATLGRWAPWLPAVAAGRVVWLAFDASRPGEADVARYRGRLRAAAAEVRRLSPPPRCKDWSTALVKRGWGVVTRWVCNGLAGQGSQAR